MIVCRTCGFRNQADPDFCESCGGFLEWIGERVEPEPSPSVQPEPGDLEAETPRMSLVRRIQQMAAEAIAPSPLPGAPRTAPAPPVVPVSPPEPAAAALPPSAPEPAEGESPGPAASPLHDRPGLAATAASSLVAPIPTPPLPPSPPAAPPPLPAPATGPVVPRQPAEVASPAPPAESQQMVSEAVGSPLGPPPAASEPPSPTAAPTVPAPTAPPAVEQRTPAELKPQARRRRTAAVEKTAPSRRLEPGDLICGQCGEGNVPTRLFCSRCGSTLSTATAVKPRWWRRLLPLRRRRGPRVVEASTQPGQPRAEFSMPKFGFGSLARTARTVVTAAVAVALVLGFAVAPIRHWVTSKASGAKNRVESLVHPTYLVVHPDRVTWHGAVPHHPGSLVGDGYKNTYWAAPARMRAPSVTFHFDKAVSLKKAIVYNGAGAHYQRNDRPNDLHVVYSTGRVTDVLLKDVATAQTVSLSNGSDVKSVTFTVDSLYRTHGAKRVELSEIELFELRI